MRSNYKVHPSPKMACSMSVAQQLFTRFLVHLLPGFTQADVREGLIAEYRFDESAGRLASDSSGQHLHGRLEGNPHWVKGYYGNGLQFDGAADYVYVGDQDALDVTHYTLTAWMRTDGRTRDPERQEIFEKAGAYWLNIRNDSHTLRAGGFFGGCRGRPYWTYLDTATTIPLHTWSGFDVQWHGPHHVSEWGAVGAQSRSQTPVYDESQAADYRC